ncbi:hypothetical protein JCM10212_001998 [Sporobolomyces blumeae]
MYRGSEHPPYPPHWPGPASVDSSTTSPASTTTFHQSSAVPVMPSAADASGSQTGQLDVPTGEEQKPKTSERSGIKRSAKACNHCRKGKARCDGFDSYPCRRCRESGVECVFEGFSADELRQRTNRRKSGVDSDTLSQEASTVSSALESRLQHIERELDKLNARNRSLEARLDQRPSTTETLPVPSTKSESPRDLEADGPEYLAREAFDSFWQHYAPLAPYISPIEDSFEVVRQRSPLLMHSIVSVASRFQDNREFVESNRADALRLIRETLLAEKPITLDDLKGILLFSAWLGRGAPPGHSVSLALQLDLPKSLERLLASIAKPPEEAAEAFTQLMPAVRIWLTLYAQDLWLSFAMGRRSMVTIDLSITNARLLLNFAALRPVDARLIAQSELVTVIGIVQETFLKMQHQTAETVHVVMQANSHLDNWIKTWGEWARNQEEVSGRYVLASLTMLLQGGRFYSNTLGLRDITKAEELLPIHMPCLRIALDAAVRIQGIHPAQKIAHAAEFTLITLSTSALFLLKMIKLTPHAFSTYAAPFYPAFPPTSPALPNGALDPSSPDVSASSESTNAPSIAQALEAVRHSAELLASVPAKQRSYHQAVSAALQRLEGELAAASLLTTLGPSPPGGAGSGNGYHAGSSNGYDGANGASGKRSRDETEHPFPPPPPGPSGSTSHRNGGSHHNGTGPSLSDQVAKPATTGHPSIAKADRGDRERASSSDDADGDREGDDFAQMSIAGLIGTDSFWSWQSMLPGEINAGLSSVLV